MAESQFESFSSGCCERALRPLLHSLPGRVSFSADHWNAYVGVNQLYAHKTIQAVQMLLHDQPLVPNLPTSPNSVHPARNPVTFWPWKRPERFFVLLLEIGDVGIFSTGAAGGVDPRPPPDVGRPDGAHPGRRAARRRPLGFRAARALPAARHAPPPAHGRPAALRTPRYRRFCLFVFFLLFFLSR